ncbi:CvpA family protein [Eubacteriales bacterium mix99]|jgi:uncharacterized membrane protein required for colicin V production
MNILDIAILFIMAVCMLNGAYNGFILSALHAASFFLSWMIAAIFYPMLSKFIVSRFPRLLSTTAFYVDGSSRIGNVENKMAKIGSFSKDQLSHVMEKTALPNPFFRILKSNIFQSANGTKSLGEFFDTTMATIVIHIVSFLLLFLITKLILNIVIDAFKTIRNLPVLKQLDGVAGMGFGLIRGIFVIYMFFALVPILMTIAPADVINEFLDGSLFAKFFYNTNIFTNLIRGSL